MYNFISHHFLFLQVICTNAYYSAKTITEFSGPELPQNDYTNQISTVYFWPETWSTIKLNIKPDEGQKMPF